MYKQQRQTESSAWLDLLCTECKNNNRFDPLSPSLSLSVALHHRMQCMYAHFSSSIVLLLNRRCILPSASPTSGGLFWDKTSRHAASQLGDRVYSVNKSDVCMRVYWLKKQWMLLPVKRFYLFWILMHVVERYSPFTNHEWIWFADFTQLLWVFSLSRDSYFYKEPVWYKCFGEWSK